MSMSRKVWQDFKKKYPQFEKHRKVKADVGPLIDKFISESQKIIKSLEALEAKMGEVKPRLAKVDAVFDEYYKVAEMIDKSWPQIEKDINKQRMTKIAIANAKAAKTGKDVEPKHTPFVQAMIDVMDNYQHKRLLSDFEDLRGLVKEEGSGFKGDLKKLAKDMQKYDVSSDW